ncbi:hypothetical protein SAMN02745157_3990 [Kaistia soli DSM 19436]|uniref:Uncharacterized protein n=1 Tax=Kaistia soli DSM 19436 TaxID=1122133 RepID=A0A1M5ISU0_9HYPH|nr:hypothetical protein [Kaistia soli]SHG31377.1 hypothetical protein SAMN02745157_3990 [Kaistia soli DSM 19436]
MPTEIDSASQLPEASDAGIQAAFDETFPRPQNIEISFFSHKTRRSTLLIGNASPENNMKARRVWLDFDFVEVIYVTEIIVHAKEYEGYHGMELSYAPYLSDNEQKTFTDYFKDGQFRFSVNDFTKGFGLRPTESLFKSAELLKVEVFGVERQHIAGIIRFVDSIEAEKASAISEFERYFLKALKTYEEIQESKAELDRTEKELEERRTELSDLDTQIQSSAAVHKKSIEDIDVAATVAKEQSSRADNIQQSIEKMTGERRILTDSIVDEERKLAEIKANINLFPTDLNGYVRQGARNVRLYAALCIIPLLIIVCVTLRLFSNSERLLDTISQLQGINIFDFLLSRLPYVSVSLTVLAICYTIVKYMIFEVISINRRRQELYKISIISQDVSYASQDNLDLSVEEKYELRTQTKMELLKEHLRQNVGDEYVYAPKRAFLEHLQRFPRRKTLTETGGESDQPL